MANQNQILNNLKTIHTLQSSGSILSFLREIRACRVQTESLQSKLDSAIKEKQAQAVKVESIKEDTKKLSEDLEPKVEISRKEDAKEVKTFVQAVKNEEKKVEVAEQKQNGNGKVFDKNFSSFDKNAKKFDKNNNRFDNKFDKNNNFNNKYQNNKNQQYNQNNFNPNYKGQRQGNNARQVGQDFKNKFVGQKSSFASTKANNFKSFVPTESSSVLAVPERQVGNKNKTPSRQLEEKRQINKKLLQKRNGYIDDYESDRMGSRKLIKTKKKEEKVFVAPAIENAVITTENVSVKVLSEKTGKPVTEIIKQLMLLGIMANINSTIDFTTAELVAGELGVKLEQKLDKTMEEKLQDATNIEIDDEGAVARPPVVTVMGHVDHGKTSLLDAFRKTKVALGEAGGITQKIGAYVTEYNGQKITFIDTPGHAAFTAMRARGAKVTDIAILVVAADDGIMPQTIEAINHIKAAGVPMIVAINKMDVQGANPERVKQQLAENGVMPEEWGGDAIVVPCSAKTGVGLDEILNMILLVAEMQALKANPDKMATGVVIEAELDKNRGPVATVLVQNGTLKIGDSFVSGLTFGKVRAMFDENGNKIKEAGPSMPVSVLGFYEVPDSGNHLYAVSEKFSKELIEERKNKIKEERTHSTSGVSLDDFMTKVNEGKLKNLNIIIKADVQGSVEALKQTLTAIKNDEVKVVCIHSAAGAVTESDLVLAKASDAIIVNFNLKTSGKIAQMAESMGVEIKDYNVIYTVVDDITSAIKGLMTVKYNEQIIGHAEVRAVFKLSSVGLVAGSYVTDGKVQRGAGARLIRVGEILETTEISALKIQKDDKAEISYGYECGIKLRDVKDLKEGDIIEAFVKVKVEN